MKLMKKKKGKILKNGLMCLMLFRMKKFILKTPEGS